MTYAQDPRGHLARAVMTIVALVVVASAGCVASGRSDRAAMTRYSPDEAWFDNGWDSTSLPAYDPVGAGVSDASISVDVTRAAGLIWPTVAGLGHTIPEGERASDYRVNAITQVWRPTGPGLASASGDQFWSTMSPAGVYLVEVQRIRDGWTTGFGLTKGASTWEFAAGMPASAYDMGRARAQIHSSSGATQFRLLCGAENICWAVYRSDSGEVRAVLLDYPRTTEMYVDGQRAERMDDLPWEDLRAEIELRF